MEGLETTDLAKELGVSGGLGGIGDAQRGVPLELRSNTIVGEHLVGSGNVG
jgi:hypothetical protein